MNKLFFFWASSFQWTTDPSHKRDCTICSRKEPIWFLSLTQWFLIMATIKSKQQPLKLQTIPHTKLSSRSLSYFSVESYEQLLWWFEKWWPNSPFCVKYPLKCVINIGVRGVIRTWWRLYRRQWAAVWRAAGFWWSQRICGGLYQQLLWRNAHLKTLALWKSQHPMCRWFVGRVLGEEVGCCWGPHSKTTKSMEEMFYEVIYFETGYKSISAINGYSESVPVWRCIPLQDPHHISLHCTWPRPLRSEMWHGQLSFPVLLGVPDKKS